MTFPRYEEQPVVLSPLAQVTEMVGSLAPQERADLGANGIIPPALEEPIVTCLAAMANENPKIGAARRLPGSGLSVFTEIIRVARDASRGSTHVGPMVGRVSRLAPLRRPEPGEAAASTTPIFISATDGRLAASGLAAVRPPQSADIPTEQLSAPDITTDATSIRSAILAATFQASPNVLQELADGNFFYIEKLLCTYFNEMRDDPPVLDAEGNAIAAGHGLAIVHTIVESASRVLSALQGLPMHADSSPTTTPFSHRPTHATPETDDTEVFVMPPQIVTITTPHTGVVSLYEKGPDGKLTLLGSYKSPRHAAPEDE